jgi:multidrug efflux pump subunit AcrB
MASIDDLRTTLANANVSIPKGNLDGPTRAYTINANDQIRKAADYNNLILAYRNGAPVKLSDVAEAIQGPQNTKLAAWRRLQEFIDSGAGDDIAGSGLAADPDLEVARRGVFDGR